MPKINLKVNVNRAKCFDDLIYLNHHIRELIDLIPDYRRNDYEPHAKRIQEIIEKWVMIEDE